MTTATQTDPSVGVRRPAVPKAAEVAVVTLAMVALLAFFRAYSVDVAGGSDGFGYVSEAYRLARGHFYEPERVFSVVGIPEDSNLTYTLGYRPSGTDGTVPTYPFGFPLLMAAAILLADPQAAYWVTPLLAVGAILLTYLTGREHLGRVGGLVAALLVTTLPNYLWSAFQPWSDVPAAFFAALAVYALLRKSPTVLTDVVLAVAIGVGVWVRPNMAIIVLPIGAYLLWKRDWRRILTVGLATLPFVAVEALLNLELYGSPWTTGYGALPLSSSVADVGARAIRHLQRLHNQQGGVGLFLVALGIAFGRLSFLQRATLMAVGVAILGFFAWYAIDDAWWYGRFLLPGLPAIALLEASFVTRCVEAGRWRALRAVAVVAALTFVVQASSGYAREQGVFTMAEGEQRYVAAGALARERVQQPAVVLAMQHSGTLRFYGGLPTARYDHSLKALLPKLRQVEQAGGSVYLLADGWELETIGKGELAMLLVGSEEIGKVEPGGVRMLKLAIPPDLGQSPPQRQTSLTFGGQIALKGFTLSAESVRAGDPLTISLDWEAIARPAHDYTVFVHLLDESGKIVVQLDSPPVDPRYPTTRWLPGLTLREERRLTIPPGTAAGKLRAAVGLYRLETMERLEPRDEAGKLLEYPIAIGSVEVAGR